jgi:hypothetical protein
MKTRTWEAPVPQRFQASFWFMVAILVLFIALAYFIRVPIYSEAFEGQWQGGGSAFPFVFKASINQEFSPQLALGRMVQIIWDANSLVATEGSVVEVVSQQTNDPMLVVEINVLSDQLIPVGAKGSVRVISAQSRALFMFWAWLRGR